MESELDQLGERIAEQAAHFDAAMHRLLTDLRSFDERGGWHAQGALSCAHWLAWRVGWDLVTARDRVRVARKLAGFSLIDDALRRGEVSYSKVRAMLRVATPANEAVLLEHAGLATASQLEKLSHKYALVQRHGETASAQDDEQRRYVRRRDTADGMVKIEAVLHPEEAELIWKMLDHAATQLQHNSAASPTGDHDSAESPADGITVAQRPKIATTLLCTAAIQADVASAGNDSAESTVGGIAVQQPSVAMAPVEAAVAGADVLAPHDYNDSGESRIGGVAVERWPAVSMTPVGALAPQSVLVLETNDSAESPVGGIAVRPSELRRAPDAAKRGFNRADALMWLAQTYLRGDRLNKSPIEVVLTIPRTSLCAQPVGVAHATADEAADTLEVGELGESFVSCETARRLSCDAGIVEFVEDEHGAPLSVGRKQRTIAGALKRALYRRDRTCTFPGCTHRIFLEGHHIRHWADGGETSLANTALLCSAHHRYVHEYGYTIELDADHRPQFRDQRGRLISSAPTATTASVQAHGLGWPWLYAANASLAIDAQTIACGWDGSRADYGLLVDHLAAIDDLQ